MKILTIPLIWLPNTMNDDKQIEDPVKTDGESSQTTATSWSAASLGTEQRFRALWETTTDAIVMLDEHSVIRYANPATLDIFGHASEELIGKNLSVLQPERLRERHRDGMQRYLTTGIRTINWRSTNLVGLHRSGHEFPIELSFSDLRLEGERQFVACIRDISDRMLNEELIKVQNSILKMVTVGADLAKTLEFMVGWIEDRSPGSLCTALLLDETRTRFVWGGAKALHADWIRPFLAIPIGPNTGSCSTAAFLNQPVFVSDIESDARWENYRELALAHGLVACSAWPIVGRAGGVLGVFAIYRRACEPPTDLELRLMETVLDLAGLAIENKKSEERILYLAHYDELTGLPNRAMFSQLLTRALSYANRYGDKVGLLFMDLDRFKNVNDNLGHATGDHVLREVGRRLRASVREVDSVARLGGDEFVVLIEKFKDSEALSNVAQKLSTTIAKPMLIEGRELELTVSIGISIYPENGSDIETLIKNSDIAMYRAKAGGRNNYQFYTSKMGANSLSRMIMESDLKRAVSRGEFLLHYQPKLNVRSGKITGAEALLRWQHPEKGLMPPLSFIPIAEESGQIEAIGRWVVHSACMQMRVWKNAGVPEIPIAVNLSARQFENNNLVSTIASALEISGISPHMLELEITESSIMGNETHAIEILNQLKALGVFLSMDDFGTGYSSLANLRRFPLHNVKIDKSFIREIPGNANDAAIAHAVIEMAHALNLQVIAEGVETAEQLAFLREHNCEQIQGYYFCHPLPPDEFVQFLSTYSPI